MNICRFIRLISAAAMIVLVSPSAFAVHDLGLFELEGDAVDAGGTVGDDWDTVNTGGGGAAFESTGLIVDTAPASIFTGGGSKDTRDISQWRHKDGSVPDKDDITNASAAAYTWANPVTGTDDLIIYGHADRLSNDGDAQIGFWLFQDIVNDEPDGTFSGEHKVGDILILANFSGGGDTPTIEVLEWVGSGGDQHRGTLQLLTDGIKCGDEADDPGCAITNTTPTPSPWNYTPKSGTPMEFPIVSFFEGGINVSEVFRLFGGGGEPPCFASFLVETRSSTSVTAQLKDFVLVSFPVCGLDITKTCDTGDINATGDGFVYNFSGNVVNEGFGTLYDVVVTDDAGTPGDTSDDQTISLGDVGAGATVPYSGSFESTMNPPTNTARVDGATVSGGPVAVSAVSDPATCPPVDKDPMLSITKDCETSLMVMDGKVVVKVDFMGMVCNTGDVKLVNVSWTDDRGTADTTDDITSALPDLAVSACESYSGSYLPGAISSSCASDVSFSDTVRANANAILDLGTAAEESATATCPVCPDSCPVP